MDTKEIKNMNITDLAKLISEKQEELRKLRFGVAGSGMRNTHAMRNLRREVAQGLTELNRRNKEA